MAETSMIRWNLKMFFDYEGQQIRLDRYKIFSHPNGHIYQDVLLNLWSSTPNPATQVCASYSSSGACTAYTWKKGSFRCDAFVKWLYTKTGNGDLGGSFPNTTFGSSLLTITRT
jgi:hypothetical protein